KTPHSPIFQPAFVRHEKPDKSTDLMPTKRRPGDTRLRSCASIKRGARLPAESGDIGARLSPGLSPGVSQRAAPVGPRVASRAVCPSVSQPVPVPRAYNAGRGRAPDEAPTSVWLRLVRSVAGPVPCWSVARQRVQELTLAAVRARRTRSPSKARRSTGSLLN